MTKYDETQLLFPVAPIRTLFWSSHWLILQLARKLKYICFSDLNKGYLIRNSALYHLEFAANQTENNFIALDRHNITWNTSMNKMICSK